MLWCPEHWTIQHKHKFALNPSYDHNARLSQTDGQTGRQTDGRTNIMAIARRSFYQRTHRALKRCDWQS